MEWVRPGLADETSRRERVELGVDQSRSRGRPDPVPVEVSLWRLAYCPRTHPS